MFTAVHLGCGLVLPQILLDHSERRRLQLSLSPSGYSLVKTKGAGASGRACTHLVGELGVGTCCEGCQFSTAYLDEAYLDDLNTVTRLVEDADNLLITSPR